MIGVAWNRSNHAPTEWLAGGGTAMKSGNWSGTQTAVRTAPAAAVARTPCQRVVVSLFGSGVVGLRIGRKSSKLGSRARYIPVRAIRQIARTVGR